MADVAIDHDVDDMLHQKTIACEPISLIKIYFYRGEFIIDGNSRFFRKRQLLKDYLIGSARKIGINTITYSESVSGYQQYQPIQNEFCDSYNSRTIAFLDVIDCSSKIESFLNVNSEILSGHMITYEEKRRLILPRKITSNDTGKEALRVFIDGARLLE